MTTRNATPRRPAPASGPAPGPAPDRGSAQTAADRLGAPRPAAAAPRPAAPKAAAPKPAPRPAAAKPAPPKAAPADMAPQPRRAAGSRPFFGLRRGPMRLRLIPLLIFVAVLMLGVRVGDVFVALTRGRQVDLVTTSQAQGAGEPGASAPAAQAADPSPQPAMPPLPSLAGTRIEPAGAADPLAGQQDGTLRAELIQRLSERRDEIDRRVREVEQREALLAAAEQRIDQKVTELSQLRSDIEKLLNQVDKRQAAQLDSLVKIYETMKPKEAARIFEEMDMPVLLSVLERMKEAKSAPVLAAMDPVKAKDVTAELVDRRALPPGVQQAARP